MDKRRSLHLALISVNSNVFDAKRNFENFKKFLFYAVKILEVYLNLPMVTIL
jgi:hypothetical protein